MAAQGSSESQELPDCVHQRSRLPLKWKILDASRLMLNMSLSQHRHRRSQRASLTVDRDSA